MLIRSYNIAGPTLTALEIQAAVAELSREIEVIAEGCYAITFVEKNPALAQGHCAADRRTRAGTYPLLHLSHVRHCVGGYG
jgi:hypothetical protein